MSDTINVKFSSTSPAANVHLMSSQTPSSTSMTEYEIKTETNSDLPYFSKKKLIQFKPTHHDIFHSSNFNGPSFKQIIIVFIMFVIVTSLCSYLYKDSLINILLILETLPWWWTSLFFTVLFTLVSLPFAWGKEKIFLLNLIKIHLFRLYIIKYSLWFFIWTCLWCDIYNNICWYWFICIILCLSFYFNK